MRRSPLKRRTELRRGTKELKRTKPKLRPGNNQLKRSRIKPRKSPAKVDYEAELDQLTPALIARADGQCELRLPGVCKGSTGRMARHHRKRRGQGGPNTLSNLLYLCDDGCHAWIHRYVKRAERMGWLVKSCEDPDEVPVKFPATRRCEI